MRPETGCVIIPGNAEMEISEAIRQLTELQDEALGLMPIEPILCDRFQGVAQKERGRSWTDSTDGNPKSVSNSMPSGTNPQIRCSIQCGKRLHVERRPWAPMSRA